MKRIAFPPLAAALLVGASACVPAIRRRPDPPTPPSAASEWPATHATAMLQLRASHPDSADRTFVEFTRRFPDSPEALEVPYWRAIVRLDPADTASSHAAVVLLQAYLANAPAGAHRAEAATLLRLQTALEAKTAMLAAQQTAPATRAEEHARDEEVQRLRDELARANAELDRIKRRLARPKP